MNFATKGDLDDVPMKWEKIGKEGRLDFNSKEWKKCATKGRLNFTPKSGWSLQPREILDSPKKMNEVCWQTSEVRLLPKKWMKFATAFSSPPSSLKNTRNFWFVNCEKHTYDPSDGANEFRSGIKIRFGLAVVEVWR